MRSPSVASTSGRSSATTSYPSSSAAQSTAIRLGTRLPTITRAPGVTRITRSSSAYTRSSILVSPIPRYVNGSLGQQSAGRTWPPQCPWATSSSSIYHPTTSANEVVMTWSSSSVPQQGTDAATSTRWMLPEDPSFYYYSKDPTPTSSDPPSVDGVTKMSSIFASRWPSTATSNHRESAQPTGGGSSSVRPWGSNVARAGPGNRLYMYGHLAVPAVVPAAKIAPQVVVHLQQQQPQPAAMRNTLPIQGYYPPSHVLLESAGSTRFDFDHYQSMPNMTKAATQTHMRGRRRVSRRWRPFMCWGCEVSC